MVPYFNDFVNHLGDSKSLVDILLFSIHTKYLVELICPVLLLDTLHTNLS
jgi:hypothetical protein